MSDHPAPFLSFRTFETRRTHVAAVLVRLGATQKAANDPAKRALVDKREELERKIDMLKYEKAAMPVEVYKKQLADALLELARVQQELDK